MIYTHLSFYIQVIFLLSLCPVVELFFVPAHSLRWSLLPLSSFFVSGLLTFCCTHY